MVPVADCQTLWVCTVNSSFPGRLLANTVNSSRFPHSCMLPSWITACAGARVSRGRAQLQKGSPLETHASCLWGGGRPGQSSPVTCFPFLSVCLFGRKAHRPPCRTQNMGWWGREREARSHLWECRRLSSCVCSAGDQHVRCEKQMCILLSDESLFFFYLRVDG